jgi:Cu(I)/Ag(I) efflux system membrane fusion protein
MRHTILILTITALLSSCSGNQKKATHDHEQVSGAKTKYTCSMHPQIVQDEPGTCPICGMDLVAIDRTACNSNDVMLNDTQVLLANITTQPVTKTSVGQTIAINARLTANEERSEVIGSRAAGRVEKLHIKESGRNVRAGDPLYELYSETLLTLQREYLLAREQYLSLGKTESRYQSFLTAAEKKLLLYGLTKQQIEELGRSKTTQPGITFLAPTSGVITEVNATEGQYLPEGGNLYRIENIDKLWVEAELYANESNYVRIGDKVTIQVSGFESDPVDAKIVFLSPEFRANTQIILMRAELKNRKQQFRPGMQAQVLFSHSSHEAIAVPPDAVIHEGKGSHVYIQVGRNTFRPQMVKTGIENFQQVEIMEGLEEKDTVVITGAYLLYSEIVLKKGGDPIAGHNHDAMRTMKSASDNKKQPQPMESGDRFTVDPKFAAQLNQLLTPYLKLKDALVESDTKAASAQSQKFFSDLQKAKITDLKESANQEWLKTLGMLAQSLRDIQNTDDLAKQRAAFAVLSDALYSAIKIFNVKGLNAYYQYCPMAFNNKGAFWISASEEISNPYFGNAMLQCGETKEILK